MEEPVLLSVPGAGSLLANPPSAHGSPGHWLSLLTGLSALRVSQFDLCRRLNELTKENSLNKTLVASI